ncbi:hypothetical protein HK097_007166 [Rhizophlyctis rosea]|uniref:Uncharacterized protein n=1 Tax=Rhizophlyctis rosea TaxID=64517 RepID=A0AAD5SC03_9FUNG|nr:hypothetical protein HK097_007166 [Rhizophlyctis rosea]
MPSVLEKRCPQPIPEDNGTDPRNGRVARLFTWSRESLRVILGGGMDTGGCDGTGMRIGGGGGARREDLRNLGDGWVEGIGAAWEDVADVEGGDLNVGTNGLDRAVGGGGRADLGGGPGRAGIVKVRGEVYCLGEVLDDTVDCEHEDNDDIGA